MSIRLVFAVTDPAELEPALSAGKIDVAIVSPDATLFNAFALGVNATFVADYLDVGEKCRRPGIPLSSSCAGNSLRSGRSSPRIPGALTGRGGRARPHDRAHLEARVSG